MLKIIWSVENMNRSNGRGIILIGRLVGIVVVLVLSNILVRMLHLNYIFYAVFLIGGIILNAQLWAKIEIMKSRRENSEYVTSNDRDVSKEEIIEADYEVKEEEKL